MSATHSTNAADSAVDAVEYRDIPGHTGCRVGSDGSVWSRWRKSSRGRGTGTFCVLGEVWKMRKLVRDKDGYCHASLRRDDGGPSRPRKVHHLVLEAFVGPRPPGMECLHDDGNPSNNRLTNLRWGTQLENASDTRRHGRHYTPWAKSDITPEQVSEVRRLVASGMSTRKAAAMAGVSKSTAHAIAARRGRYAGV